LLLFADKVQRESILEQLKALEGEAEVVLPEPMSIMVSKEFDIALARGAAKTVCETMGAPTLTTHKVATVASELTRNIVLYAGKGEVNVIGGRDSSSWVLVTASDRGPGIASLPLVLSGSYRSKTGMGKGLLGVRRLCDEFDVKTGPQGTRVQVQVRW